MGKQPYNVYLVGGAVRDELLGLPITDRDWVVTGATPEQMLAEGYVQVGRQFPVFLHPESKEEYALARTEKKQGQGYTGFICDFSPDIELSEDLRRRDLTINAIAKNRIGQLIDPFDGQKDIDLRILRHVSDAFVEDPLRVLRVARFAARFSPLGFKVAPETLALMKKICASKELETLSSERIWKETEKALTSKDCLVYFRLLDKCGALSFLMPEMENNPLLQDFYEEGDILPSLDAVQKWAVLGCRLTPSLLDRLHSRLSPPNRFTKPASQVNHFLQTYTLPMSSECWEKWLVQTSALKHPHAFSDLTDVLSLLTNTKKEDWNSIRSAMAGVSAGQLIKKGFSGAELGKALSADRISAISALQDNPLVSYDRD